MTPFDLPPSGSPADLPAPDGHAEPRRGRMALVALVTAGLIGGGIAAVSQLASADRPELAATAPDDTVAPADDEPSDEPESPSRPDGEIIIDVGDGEPIEIDLGDLGDGAFEQLRECLDLPEFDLDLRLDRWEPGEGPFGDLDQFFDDEFFESLPSLDDLRGELGNVEVFGGESSVTIAGPDGVSVVDLGENGSVTITKDGDDVTIDTTGDATVQELDELFGDIGTLFDREFDGEFGGPFGDRFDEFLEQFDEGAFDEFIEGLPAFDELPEIEPIDPEQVESCLAELRGG